MFDEQPHLPASENSKPVRFERETEWVDIEAHANACLQEQAAVHHAETVSEHADRPQVISQYLIDNELFGYEPFGEETLSALTELLMGKEASKRAVDPNFDITTHWPEPRVRRFFERKYAVADEADICDELIEQDLSYLEAEAEIREQNPRINNADLCAALLKTPDRIPATERSR